MPCDNNAKQYDGKFIYTISKDKVIYEVVVCGRGGVGRDVCGRYNIILLMIFVPQRQSCITILICRTKCKINLTLYAIIST